MGDLTAAEKERLLTIGAVAKSFGVNENTVRRIEAAGLLKPAYISERSGYRYYDTGNISLLSEILALRTFGFVYEDLREYFERDRDMRVLHRKLLDKQLALDAMVEKFSRRMNPPEDLSCRTVEYEEACCLGREITLLPTAENLAGFAKHCLYEAVRANVKINYASAIVILTDHGDIGGFRPEEPQHLTFCVLLSKPCASPELRRLPGSKALCCGWTETDRSGGGMERALGLIRQELDRRGLTQSDTLRLAYSVSGGSGGGDGPGGEAINVLVPFA